MAHTLGIHEKETRLHRPNCVRQVYLDWRPILETHSVFVPVSAWKCVMSVFFFTWFGGGSLSRNQPECRMRMSRCSWNTLLSTYK